VTSVQAIETAALELIAVQGFEGTTVEEIASAAGISRRTFFRYFESKNDVLYGDFAGMLASLEKFLAAEPTDRPIFEVIADAVVRFHRAHSDGAVEHRQRMELILRAPALRADAALRQAEWAAVLARYAAGRLGTSAHTLRPRLVAHLALGASNAAYEQWLDEDGADIIALIHEAMGAIGDLSFLGNGR
jgi:mycofactocin system transcriptional regulator